MRNYSQELEVIANDLLIQSSEGHNNDTKPNYTKRDFMNVVIIFQTALMDKMFEMQDCDDMSFDDRKIMANTCGHELRKLIHTYTGLDTHKVEEFL